MKLSAGQKPWGPEALSFKTLIGGADVSTVYNVEGLVGPGSADRFAIFTSSVAVGNSAFIDALTGTATLGGSLTAARTFYFPDSTGTIALTSDLITPAAHAIVGTSHTLAGATADHVLVATSATAFGWTSGAITFGGSAYTFTIPATGTAVLGGGAATSLARWTGANTLGSVSNGAGYMFNSGAGAIAWQTLYTTGFVNRTDGTLSIATRTVTAGTVSASYDIYTDGLKITKSGGASCQTTFADTTGIHYVYFDTGGTLQNTTSAWDIKGANVPTAIIFWNGATGHVWDERHSALRNQTWHEWAHDTIGMRWESGLDGTFGNTTLSIASGVTHDEDLDHTVTTQTTCLIVYRAAGAATMTFDSTPSTTPYRKNGANLQYDNAGTLTDAGANQYVANWLYATNDMSTPIYCVLGQSVYTTLAQAQAAGQPTIPISTAEWKLLYRVIYRNTGTTTYIESADYRNVSGVPTTNQPSSTVIAANVYTDTTGFGVLLSSADTTVQAALDTLDNHTHTSATPTAHAIDSATYHTLTGATANHLLVANSATTFGWSTGALAFGGSAYTLTVPATGTTVLGSGSATSLVYWSGNNTVANLSNGTGYLRNAGTGVFSWDSSATPSAHAIDSATYHTLSGATANHVLIANSATTFGWSAGALSFGGNYTLTIPATGTAITGGGAATSVPVWTGTNALGSITNGTGYLYNNGSGAFSWGQTTTGTSITGSGAATQIAYWSGTSTLAGGTLIQLGSSAIGFFGATPGTKSTGWSVTGTYTPLKTYVGTAVTIDQLSAFVGTMFEHLKSLGLFGA